MYDYEKETIVALHMQTYDGAQKLAATMATPISRGLEYKSPLSQIYEASESLRGTSEMIHLSAEFEYRIPWADVVHAPRYPKFDKMVSVARYKMGIALAEPLFDHIEGLPFAIGSGSEESLRKVCARLTTESEQGKLWKPVLMMNAITFAKYRRGLLSEHQRRMFECRDILSNGVPVHFEGCDILVNRRVLDGEVVVVSRGPSLVRGPLEVSARVSEYEPPKPGEVGADGRIGGHVSFHFETRMSITAWPEMLRLRVS